MKYRKLRIAFSVLCGTSCVLLTAMWLRSLWATEYLNRYSLPQYYMEVGSFSGSVRVMYGPLTNPHKPAPWTYGRKSPIPYRGFEFYTLTTLTGVGVPYWFLILLTGAIAAISAVRPYKIGLRTLLIVTAVVCVTLGVIVYPATKYF